MWPNSRIGVMGGPQAAGVLSTVKNDQNVARGNAEMTADERADFEKPILEKYEKEGSPYYASARLWDDGVIQVENTRKVLGQSLRIVSKNMDTKEGEASYGVFRT
jgi:3-methylcrotonyl-CoA carboxylase beta subunit